MADPILSAMPARHGHTWVWPDGTRLPVIAGGDGPNDQPPADPPADPPANPPAPPADDKPLGPEGEKALQAWKERARAAERDAKRTKDLEAQLAELQAAQMSEQEKALEQARKEAADAARAEERGGTNARLFRSELRAAASTEVKLDDGKVVKLADPTLLADTEVALRLLGLDEIPVTATGDIDTEAISTAVADLVKAKPYLAASATPLPGSADQGTRTPPTTKDVDDQIADAEAKGDWATARRLKLTKLAASQRP
jgi:hypothetical protein